MTLFFLLKQVWTVDITAQQTAYIRAVQELSTQPATSTSAEVVGLAVCSPRFLLKDQAHPLFSVLSFFPLFVCCCFFVFEERKKKYRKCNECFLPHFQPFLSHNLTSLYRSSR